MYKLVYLNEWDTRTTEYDPNNVRPVENGYLIRQGIHTRFIPFHRIITEQMDTANAVNQWGVGRDWLKTKGQ